MRLFEKGQGATEYLLMLAAVLVIVAIAVYYVTSTGGYPAVSATFKLDDSSDNIQMIVYSGTMAAGEWQYSISTTEGSYSWTDGPALDVGTVNLENTLADRGAGTYYCNFRHKASGHMYLTDDKMLTVA